MVTSWSKSVWEYKSPWTVTASFLLKSRETKAAKIRQLREEINELKRRESRLARQVEEKAEKITQLTVRVQQLEVQRAAPQTVTLPDDPPILQFLRKQPEAANLRNNKRPVYAAKFMRLRVGYIIFRGGDHVAVIVHKSLNMLCARRVL